MFILQVYVGSYGGFSSEDTVVAEVSVDGGALISPSASLSDHWCSLKGRVIAWLQCFLEKAEQGEWRTLTQHGARCLSSSINSISPCSQANRIIDILKMKGLSFNASHWYGAGYDAPFQIHNRHNEVWIPKA